MNSRRAVTGVVVCFGYLSMAVFAPHAAEIDIPCETFVLDSGLTLLVY